MNRVLWWVFGLAISVPLFGAPIGSKLVDMGLAPDNTYALIVGVIKWEEEGWGTFEEEGRADEAFANLLLERGVRKENLVFLKDEKATLANMQAQLLSLVIRAPAGSTFIFYFAGHGIEFSGGYYFTNYDIRDKKLDSTAFKVDFLENVLLKLFRGHRVLLFADSCHSGILGNVALRIGTKSSVKAAALTSADRAVTSTDAWTFTDGLVDIFSGKSQIDRNGDGFVSFSEASKYAYQLMKFEHAQLYGAAISPTFEADFVLSNVPKGAAETAVAGRFRALDYVEFYDSGQWRVGQLRSYAEGQYVIYYDGDLVRIAEGNVRLPEDRYFPIGTHVSVKSSCGVWRGYTGWVVAHKKGFHAVFPDGGNEQWVPYHCLVPVKK